jgi:phosphohistidine phosphatase
MTTIPFAGTMWIYLIRHGSAEEPIPGQLDHQRALTPAGIESLHRAGITWKRLLPTPMTVLTSPFLRAHQTATAFADAVGFAGEIKAIEALVPHAQPEHTVELLEAELMAKAASVAIVGHEPHLGYVLGSLLTGHPRISIPFKKGMLVAVETESATNVTAGLRFCLGQSFAADLTSRAE